MESRSFATGQIVRLKGLRSRPELNKMRGVVLEVLNNGRLKVQLEGTNNSTISVLKDNASIVDRKHRERAKANKMKSVPNWSLSMTPNQHVWQNQCSYYPIGITPAKLLTQYFPLHQHTARILLLGCGDPRHILYTLATMNAAGGLTAAQMLDITCCDAEACILARNILLFKMIVENTIDKAIIWCIFYSTVIDTVCLAQLSRVATELCQIGSDVNEYNQSEFGSKIRMCDSSTFDQVRQIWRLYAQGEVVNGEAILMEQRKNLQIKHLKLSSEQSFKDTIVLATLMQLAPASEIAIPNSDTHEEVAKKFMIKGAAPDCIYQSPSSNTQVLNPAILRGPLQRHDMHHGCDPTLGFNLATMYIRTYEGPMHYNTRKGRPTEADIYSACFNQFQSWCEAFTVYWTKNSVVVRMFAGDALDCCRLIRSRSSSMDIFLPNNSFVPVEMLLDVPREYDIIETNDVTETHGLLNTLCACTEVLDLRSHAHITSSTTGHCGLFSEGSINEIMQQELRMDLSTFCAFAGLQLTEGPSQCSLSFKNVCAAISQHAGLFSRSNAMSFVWKRVPFIARAELSDKTFNILFSGIYKRMFAGYYGNAKISQAEWKHKNCTHVEYYQPSSQTFARLVWQCAKGSASCFRGTITSETILKLLPFINFSTGLSMQSNVMQELYIWFWQIGLISLRAIDLLSSILMQQHQCTPDSAIMRYFAPNPASVVLITLLVPRAVMERLADIPLPSFELSVCACHESDHRVFSSLHMCFVKDRISVRGASNSSNGNSSNNANSSASRLLADKFTTPGEFNLKHFTLQMGTSTDYAFISFSALVPVVAMEVVDPDDVEIALCLTLQCWQRLQSLGRKDVGVDRQLFFTALSDSRHVSWRAASTNKPAATSTSTSSTSTGTGGGDHDYQSNNKSNNSSMTRARPQGIGAMSPSCAVSVLQSSVADQHCGAIAGYSCDVMLADPAQLIMADSVPKVLCVGPLDVVRTRIRPSVAADIALPPCVDLMSTHVQVSFSGGFVRLIVPCGLGCTVRLFSLYRDVDGTLAHWDMPRALLDTMPKVDPTVATSDTIWLFSLMGSQLSRTEREIADMITRRTSLIMVKEHLQAMVLHFTGHVEGQRRHQWFALADMGIPNILIHVNALCIDPSSGSVVVDAAACCLTSKLFPDMTSMIQSLISSSCLISVDASQDEILLWKYMLCSCNERVRNNWDHLPTCEYQQSSSSSSSASSTAATAGVGAAADELPTFTGTLNCPVPVCLEKGSQTTCSCCLGKGLEGTAFYKKYVKSPSFRHFFRVGLSPLFSLFDTAWGGGQPVDHQGALLTAVDYIDNTPTTQPATVTTASSSTHSSSSSSMSSTSPSLTTINNLLEGAGNDLEVVVNALGEEVTVKPRTGARARKGKRVVPVEQQTAVNSPPVAKTTPAPTTTTTTSTTSSSVSSKTAQNKKPSTPSASSSSSSAPPPPPPATQTDSPSSSSKTAATVASYLAKNVVTLDSGVCGSLGVHGSNTSSSSAVSNSKTTINVVSIPTAIQESLNAAVAASSTSSVSLGGVTIHRIEICTGCSQPAHKDAKLLLCSRCKLAQYCNQSCQRLHWSSHKMTCCSGADK